MSEVFKWEYGKGFCKKGHKISDDCYTDKRQNKVYCAKCMRAFQQKYKRQNRQLILNAKPPERLDFNTQLKIDWQSILERLESVRKMSPRFAYDMILGMKKELNEFSLRRKV